MVNRLNDTERTRIVQVPDCCQPYGTSQNSETIDPALFELEEFCRVHVVIVTSPFVRPAIPIFRTPDKIPIIGGYAVVSVIEECKCAARGIGARSSEHGCIVELGEVENGACGQVAGWENPGLVSATFEVPCLW